VIPTKEVSAALCALCVDRRGHECSVIPTKESAGSAGSALIAVDMNAA
jgi:hypothetical protein